MSSESEMTPAVASVAQKMEMCEEDKKKVDELLTEGQRNLWCKEFSTAVNQLQEACSLLSKHHGELAVECAPAFFLYGKALLELSRIENDVLFDALRGFRRKKGDDDSDVVGDGDDKIKNYGGDCDGGEGPSILDSFVEEDNVTEEEKAKISNQIIDAMIGEKDADDDAADDEKTENEKIKDENGDGEKEGEEEETKNEEDDKAASDDQNDEDGEGTAEEDDLNDENYDNKKDSEEVTNLQLAWEMIELAKSIYKKKQAELEANSDEAKELSIKQADCYTLLGEIGVDSETYTQAIEDFETAYKLLSDGLVQQDDRRLAEIKYHLGLTYISTGDFKLSIKCFKEALNICQVRLRNVVNKLKDLKYDTSIIDCGGEDKEVTDDEMQSENTEVKDLLDEFKQIKSLIPDLKIKIEETFEEEKNMTGLKAALDKDATTADAATSAVETETIGFPEANNKTNDVTAVGDITHLIRKKRKQQDLENPGEGEEEADRSKKLKVETNDGNMPNPDDVIAGNDDKENDTKIMNKMEEEMDVEKNPKNVESNEDSTAVTALLASDSNEIAG